MSLNKSGDRIMYTVLGVVVFDSHDLVKSINNDSRAKVSHVDFVKRMDKVLGTKKGISFSSVYKNGSGVLCLRVTLPERDAWRVIESFTSSGLND